MITEFQKILLRSSNSLREALIAIDKGALRFAIVTNKDGKLVGSITDGDIRRALIAGSALNDSIDGIFNSSPIFVSLDSHKTEIKKVLIEKSLLAVPVVDNGVVIGLHTLTSLSEIPQKTNPVFIMAGGFGTRLKPLTDNCPKPMLRVGDKPMLEILINQFKAQGFSKFFISTHYLPESITSYFGDGREFGVEIEYVFEEKPLGTGGALSLLPKHKINEDVVVVNGDVLTTLDFSDLLSKHQALGSRASMCVREFDYTIPYGVVQTDDSVITGFVEKPSHNYQVNAGIYIISKEIIDSVANDTKIDMPTLFEQHFSESVNAIPFYDYWLDIGKMDDYEKAQKDIVQLNL